MSNTYQIYLISDSTGETLDRIFTAIKAQFKNIDYKIHTYSFTRTENQIFKILSDAEKHLNSIILYSIVDSNLAKFLANTSEDKKIWKGLTYQNDPQMLQYNSTTPNDTSFNVLSNTSVYSQSYGLNVSVVCGNGSHHIFLTLIHRSHSELGIGHKDFTLDKLHNRETNFVKSYKPDIVGVDWLLYSNDISSNKIGVLDVNITSTNIYLLGTAYRINSTNTNYDKCIFVMKISHEGVLDDSWNQTLSLIHI